MAHWRGVIAEHCCPVHFVGDALGVLHGLTSFRAADPGVNLIAMELALLFAPTGLDLSATHLWSEQNCLADALSRQHEDQPPPMPALLAGVPASSRRPAPWRILGAIAVSRPKARRRGES